MFIGACVCVLGFYSAPRPPLGAHNRLPGELAGEGGWSLCFFLSWGSLSLAFSSPSVHPSLIRPFISLLTLINFTSAYVGASALRLICFYCYFLGKIIVWNDSIHEATHAFLSEGQYYRSWLEANTHLQCTCACCLCLHFPHNSNISD